MASRFWIGGAGNISDTAKWSATSGGAGGASVPTSADTATFDLMSNSGAYTVTMDATFTCSDLTVGAPMIGAVTFTSSGAWDIYGSVSIVSSTVMSAATGIMTFRATSGTKTISFNGTQLASSIVFNGSAGTFQLTSALTTSGAAWTRTAGTFSSNSQTVTLNGGYMIVSGTSLSFFNLTVTGTAAFNNYITFGSSTTFTGTLTITGNSAVNRMFVLSGTLGTAITLTCAAISFNAVDLRDITKAGAASGDISGASNYTGDCGGCSGWTFTTAASQSWSGTSGGNWSANAWTSRVPLPQDNVTINAAFTAGQTVTTNTLRSGKSITWANTGNSVTWAKTTAFSIYGSLTTTGTSLMTNSGTSLITFEGRSSFTITSNGQTLTNAVTQNTVGGTLTMQDAFTTSSTLTVTSGTFVGNNFNHSATSWSFANSASVTATLGTGTYTASGTGSVWSVGASTVFSGASATLLISNTSATSKTVAAAGKTYGGWRVVSGTGTIILTGNNTFDSIQNNSSSGTAFLQLPASGTQTITGGAAALSANGLGGIVNIVSSTPGTQYKVTSTTACLCTNLSITDCDADGTVPFMAGTGSTNVSNNTDWRFAITAGLAVNVGGITASETATATIGSTRAMSVGAVTVANTASITVGSSQSLSLASSTLSNTGANAVSSARAMSLGAITLAESLAAVVTSNQAATISSVTASDAGSVTVSAAVTASIANTSQSLASSVSTSAVQSLVVSAVTPQQQAANTVTYSHSGVVGQVASGTASGAINGVRQSATVSGITSQGVSAAVVTGSGAAVISSVGDSTVSAAAISASRSDSVGMTNASAAASPLQSTIAASLGSIGASESASNSITASQSRTLDSTRMEAILLSTINSMLSQNAGAIGTLTALEHQATLRSIFGSTLFGSTFIKTSQQA